MTEIAAINVGKWSVGRDNAMGAAVIKLEWTNRPPLALIIPIDQATEIAKALLDLGNAPSSPNRPN
ncbi:MAG: hypothetical protein KAY22_27370 [Rhizorhabdus sp.]|uniref:hypothetical protein n=1 Tax=Rhizorhabdus sp. TaxID=1968843 RepID=UPI001B681C55|nr:hypothetical protein [Rhizorhabdus sp.]MBP8236012.1 hypothetical protein [Rhizorhabdus sp.]